MADNIDILIDGTSYGLPVNWRQLIMNYQFDGISLLQQSIPGKMEFCGPEPYTTILNNLYNGLCGTTETQLQIQCGTTIPALSTIWTALSKLAEAEFSCNPCAVDISSNAVNAYTELENNATETLCMNCDDYQVAPNTDAIRIRQIQSGGVHIEPDGSTDVTRCFIRVDNLVSALLTEINYTTGGALALPPWGNRFQHDIYRITIPNVNDNSISIYIQNEWGTVHQATIAFIGGESLDERAEFLGKALIAKPYPNGPGGSGFGPQAFEMFHYISAVKYDAGDNNMGPANTDPPLAVISNRVSGELDIITDWPIKTITAAGDVNGALTITQKMTYQYGLGELMMSTNGMNTDSVCLTWSELKEFISCVHPTVFIPDTSSDDFEYGGYDNEINNAPTILAQPTLTPKNVKQRLRSDILDKKGFFGQNSLVENIEDGNADWEWYGETTSIFGTQAGPIPTAPPYRAAFTPTTGGLAFIDGTLLIVNGGATDATIWMSLWPNNTGAGTPTIGEDNAIDIAAGQTKEIHLTNNNILVNSTACVSAGVTYYLRYRLTAGTAASIVVTNTATGFDNASLSVSIFAGDEDYPLTTDETIFRTEDPYYEFLDFADCSGVRDCELPSKFYTGIGYAFTQQLDETNDYGDMIFCSFQSPENEGDGTINNDPDQTWMFERQMYFDSGISFACFAGQTISYYYHNIPIQHPWIAYEWSKYFPTDFSFDVYTFNNSLISTGTGNEPTVNSASTNLLANTGVVTKVHNRLFEYDFEDCNDLATHFFRGQNRTADVEICDFGTISGVIREMSVPFSEQGLRQYVLEGENAAIPYPLAIIIHTTKQVNFTFDISGGTGTIAWGDGSSEAFDASGSPQSPIHTYASAGTHIVKIYCTPSDVVYILCDNEQVTYIDISQCTGMTRLDAFDNTGLTQIKNPVSTVTWTRYYAYNTAQSTWDGSGLLGLGGVVYLHTNTSLTSFIAPFSPKNITQFYCYNNTALTALNVSGLTNLSGQFVVTGNTIMSSLVLPPSSGTITQFLVYDCNITGDLDATGLTLSSNISAYNNPNMTDLLLTSSANVFTTFRVDDCDLTGTFVVPYTNLGGNFRVNGNANLTNVTFSASGQTFTVFWMYDCDLTGTQDISMLTGLGGSVLLSNNPNLTGLTTPASSATINILDVGQCDLGYFDITGMTFSSTVLLGYEDNNMTAAEVNHHLVDMDSTLPAVGTGTIIINGTNAAPDTTSGGFNGSAAKTSLQGKGYTVTTN